MDRRIPLFSPLQRSAQDDGKFYIFFSRRSLRDDVVHKPVRMPAQQWEGEEINEENLI